ncbi:MAG: DUF4292 domain-containing protein [Prevotellaceae bacterium]|nr:DUF4292 domain-containing protein [Prevotellaceae bacterium]
MKTHRKLFLLTLIVVLLSACSGSREAAVSRPEAAVSQTARSVAKNRLTTDNLTARLKLELSQGGKSVSCGGTLRMRRGEVVQIVLTFLGFEVGRIEFSPADVLLIDKVHGQYVRASYADVSFLRDAGLDFSALQALFWNELFIPGSQSAESRLDRFRVSTSGDHTLLQLTDTPGLQYEFLVSTATALIESVTASSRPGATPGSLAWNYSDFQKVAGGRFPAAMKAVFKGLDREVGLTLSLSRMSTSADWQAHTTPKDSYKRRNADDILRALIQM